MRKMELNHWFIKDNQLSIALLRFHVTIHISSENNSIFCTLRVVDSNQDCFIFFFSTLEEAVLFTENTIQECKTSQEIVEAYQSQFGKEKKKCK